MRRRRTRAGLVVLVSSTFVTTAARGTATYIWTGPGGSASSPTSGSWSTPTNWVGATVPAQGQTTALQFGGSATAYTSTNDATPAPFVLNRLLLSSSSQATVNTIDGSALEFVTDRSVQAIAPSIQPSGGMFLINNDLVLDAAVRVGGKQGFVTLAGVISGSGSLVANTASTLASLIITHANTYTGGTTVIGRLTVTGAGTLGSGPVTVTRDGLYADSASNIASGAGSVTIQAGGFAQFGTLDAAALATINAASAGVVTVAADFAGPLDFTALPLLRLGGNATNVTVSSAITPGGDTYRFGGMASTSSSNALQRDRLNIASLLTDDGATPRAVDVGSGGLTNGMRLSLTNPANSYSGGTVVGKSASATTSNFLYFDWTPATGETPLGTGPVTVYDALLFGGAAGGVGALPNALVFKPGSKVYFDNSAVSASVDRWPDAKPMALDSSTLEVRGSVTGATAETIGVLSAAGASMATISRGATGVTSEVQVASLARTGRGTLAIKTAQTDALGTDNLFKVADASNVVNAATGMLAPWVMGIADGFSTNPMGEFLQLRASDNAVVPVTYVTAFNPSTPNEIVAFGTQVGEVSGDESVWALKAQANSSTAQTVHVSAGTSLTIGSGGMTLNGCTIYGGGTIRFGTAAAPAEGVVYVGQFPATIATPLAGTQGLTKTGAVALTLSADDSQLTGPITINQGTLLVGNANALNGNPLTVSDLGALDLNGFDVTVSSLSGAGAVTNKKNGWTAGQTLTVNQSADTTFAGTLTDTPGLGVLALTKSGAGTLTLAGTLAYSGLTTVSGGTLVVAPSAANTFGGNTAYATAAGTHLVFAGPRNIGTITGSGDVSLTDGALVTTTSLSQPAVTLTGDATLRIWPTTGTPAISTVGALSATAGSTLDLTNNTLVLTATPADTVRQYLRDGRLSTSTPDPSDILALGYLSDDAGGVTVTLTYAGDANLDGRVDPDDYALLDRGMAKGLSDWAGGDFDYDGQVTPADYMTIDRTYVLQGAPLSPAFLADREARFGGGYVAALVASVPEPSTGLVALAVLAIPSRVRRRREGPILPAAR